MFSCEDQRKMAENLGGGSMQNMLAGSRMLTITRKYACTYCYNNSWAWGHNNNYVLLYSNPGSPTWYPPTPTHSCLPACLLTSLPLPPISQSFSESTYQAERTSILSDNDRSSPIEVQNDLGHSHSNQRIWRNGAEKVWKLLLVVKSHRRGCIWNLQSHRRGCIWNLLKEPLNYYQSRMSPPKVPPSRFPL